MATQEMELWDVYDQHRAKTGKTMRRGEHFEGDAYHIVIYVCLFNLKGQMLIQQRQTFKRGWPNLWDITASGSAVSGETSQQAAERELFEEIGYRHNFSGVMPQLSLYYEHGFYDTFLAVIEEEIDVDSLQLQYEEVQRVKWATKAEIIRMIKAGEFIDYHEELIDLLFAMRNKYGAHTS